MANENAFKRGEEPSIVESFRIEGLYGYRTISLSSKFAATVLIAKNGSGKTTLLAALDAFLKGQFSRLRDIKFARICCKLRGVSEELVLTPIDIQAYMTVPSRGEFEIQARRLEVEPEALLTFLEEYRDSDSIVFPTDNKVITAIMRRVDYTRADAQVLIDNLRASIAANSPAIAFILTTLKKALSDTEIVYLPTYRRIELSIGPEKDQ
jgi:predicted ATP-dependent endonuclease of OLD family